MRVVRGIILAVLLVSIMATGASAACTLTQVSVSPPNLNDYLSGNSYIEWQKNNATEDETSCVFHVEYTRDGTNWYSATPSGTNAGTMNMTWDTFDCSGRSGSSSNHCRDDTDFVVRILNGGTQLGISNQFAVDNTPPVMNVNGPYTCEENETKTLNTSGTFDATSNIVSWEWDLDNDGNYDDSTDANASYHCVNNSGVYTLGLRVTDSAGNINTTSTTVNITNVHPNVTVIYPNGNDYEGGNVNIQWLATDTRDVLTIDLEYSDNNGTTWNAIPNATGINNTGSFVWDTTGLNDVDFLVRATADDNTTTTNDTSDNVFTLDNTAPTADAGADTTINETANATLNATSTVDTFGDGNLNYTWDYDSGNFTDAIGVTPVFNPRNLSKYPNIEGVYNVTVRVEDRAGNIDEDYVLLTVNNVAPTVGVSYPNGGESLSGNVDINWTANDVDSLTIDLKYSEDNGTTWNAIPNATGINNTGTFVWDTTNLSGTNFKVMALANDSTVIINDTSANVFTIDSTPPVAEANGPYNCTEGQNITVTSNGSNGNVVGIASYGWDLNGNGLYNDSMTENATFNCVDDGVYTVTVKVTDNNGLSSTDNATVTVNNVIPDVGVESNKALNEGATFTANNSFSDVGTQDTHDALVIWGDGSNTTHTNVTSPLNINHVYADNGVYTVVVTITDDDGGVDTDTINVTVSNVAPVLVIGPNKTINESQSILLSSTFTDAGSADTHNVFVDWGDGSNSTLNNETSPLNESHVYANDGVYTVNVTVTDDDGNSSWDTFTTTVNNVAPTVKINDPQNNDDLKGTVNINWSSADPGNDSVTMVVEYSDDNGATWTVDDNDTIMPNVSGTYNHDWDTSSLADGTYVIRVTVTDEDGASNYANVTGLTVDNTASTSRAPEVAPNPVIAGNLATFTGEINDGFAVNNSKLYVKDSTGTVVYSANMNPSDGNYDSANETVELTVPGSNTSTWSGTYTFWISGQDNAGNWQTQTQDNTDSFVVNAQSVYYTKAEIESKLNLLNTSINNNTGRIVTLEGQVANLTQDVIDLDTELNGVQANVSILRGVVIGHNNSINTLQQQMSDAQNDITNLSSDMLNANANIGTLTTRVDSINGSMQNMSTDISTLQGSVTTLDGRVNSINLSVQALNTQMGTVQGNITTLDGRVSSLETTVADHTTNISNLYAQIALLYANDTALLNKINAVNSSLNNLDAKVNGVRTNVSNLQTTVAGHTTSIGTLQTQMTQANGNITVIKADILSLDGNLTTLRTDFNTLNTQVQAYFNFNIVDNTQNDWANGVGTLAVNTTRSATCTYTNMLNRTDTGAMTTADNLAHTKGKTIDDLSYFRIVCTDNVQGFQKDLYIFVQPAQNSTLQGYTKTVDLDRTMNGFFMAKTEYQANPNLGGDYSITNMMSSVINWASVSEYDFSTNTWKTYVNGVGGTMTEFSATMGYYVIEMNPGSQEVWDIG